MKMAAVNAMTKPAIEKLLDFFVAKDGTAYYQVKWKPTWETAESLVRFADLVEEFWKFVNDSTAANIYKNNANIPKPDPILPAPIQRRPSDNQITQNYNTSGHQNVAAPTTPQRRSSSTSSASQRRPSSTSTTPQRRPSSNATTPQRSNPPTPTQMPSMPEFGTINMQQAPLLNSKQQAAVIIDSDEENDTMQPLNPSTIQSAISQIPSCANVTNNQQQIHQMSPTWGAQIKTEQADIKPIFQQQQQPNMFNQNNVNPMNTNDPRFQFNMQNTLSSPRGPNSSIRGQGGSPARARGGRGGGPSPAKRKLGIPSSPISSVKQPYGGMVKTEPPDNKNIVDLTPDLKPSLNAPSLTNFSKWEDHFEILEKRNFDGSTVEVQYECKICGTVISNKGSCKRHFNKHSGEGSHNCPICQKVFHRLDYLQRHLKTHGQCGGKELEGLIKLAMESVKK
ncbi:uncharacterized protein LOC130635846 isoform X3 [Hydractinia symbiolongicarpus]|uniref:uncharacterized protein LOC130635846 isoform X3 n=1 Tax=Hydractinia symbiolongicarpus TaxID=13093 RepID=UPI00254CD44A|nr:uncharacterized protein LOC130635846 isoform X3 [Hydractinia symbiolongicarpus]